MHLLALAMAVLLATVSAPAAAQMPAAIAAPGQDAVATFQATGAQVYECKAGNDGKLSWAFREPIATRLLDGQTIGRHYVGPTWEHSGSIPAALPPGSKLRKFPEPNSAANSIAEFAPSRAPSTELGLTISENVSWQSISLMKSEFRKVASSPFIIGTAGHLRSHANSGASLDFGYVTSAGMWASDGDIAQGYSSAGMCHRTQSDTRRAEELTWFFAGGPQIVVHGLPGLLGNFESDRNAFLPVGSAIDGISVKGDVVDLECDDIASAQLAVDSEIEHRPSRGFVLRFAAWSGSTRRRGGFAPISLPLSQVTRLGSAGNGLSSFCMTLL